MKPRCLVYLLGVLVVYGVGLGWFAAPVSAEEEANVQFRWAFGARLQREKPPKLVAITQDTTLHTGDQLKMLVELHTPCFVYVIYHGPQGDIQWLFPAPPQSFDTDYQTAKPYPIPPGEAWIRLDHQVGHETFYVLASAERLTTLESLLTAYAQAPHAEQQEIATDIVSAIRDVKKRYRQFATRAERPVPIAGNMRGQMLGDLAVEIRADNFYSKTFTIEHR